MGVFRILVGLLKTVGFLIRAAFAFVFVAVGWLVVQSMVNAGELPTRPVGVVEYGLPGTVLGIPTIYAAGLLLFGGMVLFGDGGGGSTSGGGMAGGGFGGGDGGGGGGDGGE